MNKFKHADSPFCMPQVVCGNVGIVSGKHNYHTVDYLGKVWKTNQTKNRMYLYTTNGISIKSNLISYVIICSRLPANIYNKCTRFNDRYN